MQINYLVNRVSVNPTFVMATIEGEEMQVEIKELEVELVDESGKNGTQVLRFRSQADKEAALAKYIEGETFTIEV